MDSDAGRALWRLRAWRPRPAADVQPTSEQPDALEQAPALEQIPAPEQAAAAAPFPHLRIVAAAPTAESPTASEAAPGRGPRVPELSALLGEIDALRLALSADLGAAASAVEVEAYDVARDVVAGGQDDLAAFSVRARHHLAAEPEADAGDSEAGADPVSSRIRAGRGRRLALLAPALTAAAALVGLLAGVVPAPGPGATGRAPMTNAAAASYAELWRLHERGAPAPRLAEAARELHTEVARLVALAAEDPATAERALQLLELELRLLDDAKHDGALRPELVESQRLVAVLRSAVRGAPVGPLLRQLPKESRPAPVARRTLAEPPLEGPAPAVADLSPVVAPEPPPPSSEPEPAEEAPPSPEPTPEPSAEPSPSPSPSEPGSWLPNGSDTGDEDSGSNEVVPG